MVPVPINKNMGPFFDLIFGFGVILRFRITLALSIFESKIIPNDPAFKMDRCIVRPLGAPYSALCGTAETLAIACGGTLCKQKRHEFWENGASFGSIWSGIQWNS